MVALAPLVDEWREMGLDVTIVGSEGVNEDSYFDTYDIVHFGWVAFYKPWLERGGVTPPVTANMWNLGFQMHVREQYLLGAREFAHIFVDDCGTLMGLGINGHTNVTLAPMVVNRRLHKPLPSPKHFAAGTLCVAVFDKRADVVIGGCQEAGIECLAYVFPPTYRNFNALRPSEDVYARLSVYVQAAFIDTNSLPAMEALATGRPIVAIRSEGISRILQDGVNGLFFDGSVPDLARKLIVIRDNYPYFVEGALATKFPEPRTSAQLYVNVWKELV